jgi:hypothetical protein
MKRMALMTLILGTVLAVAPAAHAIVWSDGGSSSDTYVQVPPAGTSQVTDGWMSSVTPSTSYAFQTDILGGDGGATTAPIPTATGDDSFAWGTVGIGAATLVGVMLLGLGSLAVTRRRHQPSF